MPRTDSYPAEFRAEAVRLFRTSDKSLAEMAGDLGISRESLRWWIKQQDIDEGARDGLTTDEREEFNRVRRENRVLREEREILKNPMGQLLDPFVRTGSDPSAARLAASDAVGRDLGAVERHHSGLDETRLGAQRESLRKEPVECHLMGLAESGRWWCGRGRNWR